MVVILLVAVGVLAGLVTWSISGNDTPTATPGRSGPPPVTTTPPAMPTTTPPPAEPTAIAPPAAPPGVPTTGPPLPPSVTAEPPAGLAETVDSVIAAVQAGQATGQIRDDVAVDLINLLHQLDTAAPDDVSRQVAELQRKIRDRISEGGLTRTYADELHNRLDRVARA
jgi:serine/threonine-protein kinase